MKLSIEARAILLAKALKSDKPAAGRYADGRNLYLSVSQTGAKSWVFLYSAAGRAREIGLGSATGAGSTTSLTLKQARLAADKVRCEIAAGIDPVAAKVQAKVQAQKGMITFADLLAETVAILKGTGAGGWKTVNGVCAQEIEWNASLTKHAGALLPKLVNRIDDDAVLSVLKPIWVTIPTTAERIRYRVEKVMEVALARGIATGKNPARYDGHIEHHVGKRPTSKDKVGHVQMHFDAIPAFMAKLLPLKGNASRGLAFTVLTAVRTDEAREARWSEIDLDKALWVIPAERMKADVPHVVPLSTAALALLRLVPRLVGNDYVFTGQKDGSVVGPTAFSDKLTDAPAKGGMGLKGEATVHGFRKTFRNWAGETLRGYTTQDFEFCLAHRLDAVEGAYRTMTAVETRREIMQKWADYCAGVSNVVKLAVAA